jgi:hypothetical protein
MRWIAFLQRVLSPKISEERRLSMKERMPIWLQAMALGLLSCAFMVTLCFVWRQEQTLPIPWGYVLEDATYNILYFAMPVPIIFLGARFFCRFFMLPNEGPRAPPSFTGLLWSSSCLLCLPWVVGRSSQRRRDFERQAVCRRRFRFLLK